MPDGKTHLITGAATGAIVNLIVQNGEMAGDPKRPFDWGEFILCAGIGAAAGLAPDLLEPATSPNHRQFFHSVVAAGLVAWMISGKHTRTLSRGTKLVLFVLGFGYLSHIALDCTTPKAINFI